MEYKEFVLIYPERIEFVDTLTSREKADADIVIGVSDEPKCYVIKDRHGYWHLP